MHPFLVSFVSTTFTTLVSLFLFCEYGSRVGRRRTNGSPQAIFGTHFSVSATNGKEGAKKSSVVSFTSGSMVCQDVKKGGMSFVTRRSGGNVWGLCPVATVTEGFW